MKTTNLFFLLLLLALTSCSDDDDIIDVITGETPVDVTGITYVQDKDDALNDLYSDIRGDLQAAGPISIVAEVNHQLNAVNAGLDLRPTRVIMFGNPALGTPLMQQNMEAGLDLPQKIVFYQTNDGDVIVGYNSTRYLSSRHELTDDGELTQIGNALQNFVENNTGEEVRNSLDSRVEAGEGIIETIFALPVEEVYANIRAAIAGNANLTILAELDHAANAASVGLTLAPSKLIVFGNPAVGTPWMQDEQSVAIDLPQKILVFQNANNTTSVIYNDANFIAERHNVDEDLPEIETVASALASLVAAGAGN